VFHTCIFAMYRNYNYLNYIVGWFLSRGFPFFYFSLNILYFFPSYHPSSWGWKISLDALVACMQMLRWVVLGKNMH
jgi:hypothetical protein